MIMIAKKLRHWHSRWHKQPLLKQLARRANQPNVGQYYLWGSLAVLLLTTLLWAGLGADVQRQNADQLVNPYLFQDGATFQGAIFPIAHSFLLKWPLFYLIKLAGFNMASFLVLTIAVSLLTVGVFAYVLWRIERRPLVLGTLWLMLAAVLLMIPAQPYAGGILPVNMAMLTTRNIEYIVYILGLWLIVRSRHLRSRQALLGVMVLGLLVASDGLFLSITLAGSLLALINYALRQKTEFARLSAHWLLLGVAGILLGLSVTSAINLSHVTHVSSQSIAGPYGIDKTSRDFGLGAIYAVGGLLTNFGANPGYDAVTLSQVPSHTWHHLLSIGGPAFVVNALSFLVIVGVALWLALRSLVPKSKSHLERSQAYQLWLLLFWATLATIGLFVGTSHYYVVDSRYLTLALFSGFIGLAVYARSRRWHNDSLLVIGAVLAVGILSGIGNTLQTHASQKAALAPLEQRNKSVAQILHRHHVDIVVGDYWRVIPLKAEFDHQQTVLPLTNCDQNRDVLTSLHWEPDLRQHSFAYLLTIHGSLTDFPSCSLNQVDQAYGLPNSSVLIAGSLAHPQELLLFYDSGAHPDTLHLTNVGRSTGTILPIALDDVPHTLCNGPSVMNIVAHQDDDLLFMSPDLLHDVQAAHCVRTVYLTAGDAGAAEPYWLAREQGSEAAYSEMLGMKKPLWVERTVSIGPNEFAIIANPLSNSRISLIFLRLPDGNLRGEGFAASQFQSLQRLRDGKLAVIHSTDGQSSYTSSQLVAALEALMRAYQPAEIRTQSSFPSQQYPDHSDHRTTGQFATQAYNAYETEQFSNQVVVPLRYYIGYPIHAMPDNVGDGDLAGKEAAFLAYAHYDSDVCATIDNCHHTATYGAYLSRQYTSPY